ncbi:hypothetical protein O6H91_23G022900 [Diphasiastrum complanatum]|uniref:Uncharacterized protein n=1 Tax=Diphasiastrum complanatum TaxID=34168 RepID=A0ACC2A8X6_DIPCM|nr:hypothetical protein O6H91_23G022900 [Diphasiastrum complanatum]
MLSVTVAVRSTNGLVLPCGLPSLKIDDEAIPLPTVSTCLSPLFYRSPKTLMMYDQVPKGQSTPPFKDTQCGKTSSPKSSRIINSGATFSTSIAPLKLESPAGQYLVSMLQSNPHLFYSAVDHELEQLAAEENVALQELPKVSGHLLTLYRKIADVKARERCMVLKELMYALVVQKFVETGIALTPSLSNKDVLANIGSPPDEKQLEMIHSSEALEMIKDHLYSVIEGKEGISLKHDGGTMVKISRFRVGQLYASSIVYGYFIRRVDQRFQLERRMKHLASGLNQRHEVDDAIQKSRYGGDGEARGSNEIFVSSGLNRFKGTSGLQSDGELNAKLRKLKAYVSSFDPQTLDQYATLRYRETLDVIEKQAEALFGRPDLEVELDPFGQKANIHLTSLQLKLLVLEAVAFGSFLWDVESIVESQCTLHPVSQ